MDNILTKDQQSVVDRLRKANQEGTNCTIYNNEVHLPLNAFTEVLRLTVELAAVTRERDAAVSDLKRASICDQCTHWPTMNLATFTCEIAGKKPFSACKHYEWHGVQAPDRAEGEKHG